MTAGQFISLDLLHKHFGKVRVRETGVRLREASLFERGWNFIDPIVAANFLYALFATTSPKYVVRAIDRGHESFGPPNKRHADRDRMLISVIARIIAEKDFRDKVDYILVSQKDGSAEIYYKGERIPENFSGPHVGQDYDGFLFEDVEVNQYTYVGWKFFDRLASLLNYEKENTQPN
jgi:hypothetical protein